MDNLTISITSMIIGVIATIVVSRHYFTRARRKAMTPFIQFSTSVFRGVDPSVREALKIAYKGIPITDLFEIQFLIANTGEKSIRDLIKPLTLTVPEGSTILDASILHIHPDGRDVFIETAERNVVFNFLLLNSQEFFIAKLLLEGDPHPKDFEFTISVDDLPPTLTPELLPPNLVESDEKRGFEVGLLVVGLTITALGVSISSLIYAQWTAISQVWSVGLIETLASSWGTLITSAIAGFAALLCMVIGPMVIIAAFTNFSFPGRTRFTIPSDVRRPFTLHRFEFDYIDIKKDKSRQP